MTDIEWIVFEDNPVMEWSSIDANVNTTDISTEFLSSIKPFDSALTSVVNGRIIHSLINTWKWTM